MLLAFHVIDDEPTWAPLERLRTQAEREPGTPQPDLGRYLYMGRVVTEDGSTTIHLYKHQLTRHYLNLDDECRAYRFAGVADDDHTSSWYEPIDDVAVAIAHAQGTPA